MDEKLWVLINQIQDLSPTVWEIALRQVDAQIQGLIMWRLPALIMLSAMLLLELIMFSGWSIEYNNYDRGGIFGAMIFWAIIILIAVYVVVQSVYIDVAMMKQNPEYYAIKIIINTLK